MSSDVGDIRQQMHVIQTLLNALDIADDSLTPEQVAERTCWDCVSEGGTLHLLWHLIEQRDEARRALQRLSEGVAAAAADLEEDARLARRRHEFPAHNNCAFRLRALLGTPAVKP